jgi:hypothetical protein
LAARLSGKILELSRTILGFEILDQSRIWEIMAEDFAESGSALRHGSCAPLAKADAVALACAFEDDDTFCAPNGEVVAWHSIPSQAPIDGQSACFAFPEQASCVQL